MVHKSDSSTMADKDKVLQRHHGFIKVNPTRPFAENLFSDQAMHRICSKRDV
jgi:hypothetical protein